MSEFTFLFRGRETAVSPEQMQRTMEKWLVWMKEITAKDQVISLGHPLEETGAVVQGRDKLVIDGPFAEAKDVVGGYMLIKARDLAQATEIARGCPILEVGGSVEIRQIQQMKRPDGA